MTAAASEVDDADVIAPHAADALLAGAPWRRVALVGDSIVAGVGDPVPGYRTLGWCQRVVEALGRVGPGLAVADLAEPELVAERVREQQLAAAVAFGPDLAFVGAGGNDLFRRRFDVGRVRADYEAIVGGLGQAGATVVTWTLFDIRRAPIEFPEAFAAVLAERYDPLQEMFRRVAADLGTVFIDFADDPHGAELAFYSGDLRHVTMRGHAVTASVAIRTLGALLEASPASRTAG